MPVVEQMADMAFSARDLARAADIYDRMLRDGQCGVILTLAGSLISAGLKQVFVDMIRNRMVDAIDICGDAAHVARAVQAYRDAGVDAPVVMPPPWGEARVATTDATLDAVTARAVPLTHPSPAAPAADERTGLSWGRKL